MNEYYKIIAWSDCGYCSKAKELLLGANKQVLFCIVDESKELLQHYKDDNDWQTVPMIFHYQRKTKSDWSSEFVGGYSDLVKRFESNGADNAEDV